MVRVHLETLCEFGQRAITADGARATFPLNEGLWVLRVRLDMDSRRVDCIGNKVATLHLKFRQNLSNQTEPPLAYAWERVLVVRGAGLRYAPAKATADTRPIWCVCGR